MKYIVDGDLGLSQPPTGPLAAQIGDFATWAREQGYARCSRYRKILLATCFSGRLGRQAITRHGVSSKDASRYLQVRARRVPRRKGDAAAPDAYVRNGHDAMRAVLVKSLICPIR